MKKNKKYMLFFVVGFLSIVLGIILININQPNSTNKDDNKKDETKPLEPTFNLKVDTSKLELKDVDLSSFEFIDLDLSKETFIKSTDMSVRNKYIFNYSKELLSNNVSDMSVLLYSSDYDLNVNIVNLNIEKYYNDVLKKDFEKQKEKVKQEYYVTEIVKNNDIDIMYAKTSSLQGKVYTENFYFIIQESDSASVVFNLCIRNHRVSDEELTKFINNIKIDKNNAEYLYSTISDDKQTLKLSLRQTCLSKNSDNIVELELPTSLFKEEERYYNSNRITTFSIKNSKDSSAIVSSNCNYDKNLLINIGNNAKKSYQKIENYKLENKEINNKKFQILSFKYFQNNIECNKVYIVGLNKDIGYYMVEITSLGEITDDVINNLTNIEFSNTEEVKYEE